MSDIVEALRFVANEPPGEFRSAQDRLCDEAADEIESLRTRNQALADANARWLQRDVELRARLAELESRQSTHHCANCEDMGRRLDEAEKLLRWISMDAETMEAIEEREAVDAFLAGSQP